MGGSTEVTSCGPCRHENPAGSIIIMGGENPSHRKGKGSSATIIGRGLAGPNPVPNWTRENREAG